MGAVLNWIDTLFFGVRRLFDEADGELPERPAVKFAGACSVVDDPANNRTVITVGGLLPDQGGGFTIGTAAGGWVTVKGGMLLADVQGAQPAPQGGAYLYALGGALRVAQQAPPVVSGSRGGNAGLASLLAALANAGHIVNNTTP